MDKPSDFRGALFLDDARPRRVVVVGANGAGKTLFATQLADRMQALLIHKDALALTTGWQQRPRAEVQAAIAARIKADDWVLEGGSSILTSAILARADLVIWLDIPGPLRFWRILRRSLRYAGRVRPELPAGNRDWPGLRQWRFAWRALWAGDQFTATTTRALHGSSVPLVRLRSRDAVAEWFARPGLDP
jgi:adenylate kinase family enzyme